MKQLKRLLLIHWHFFNYEVVEMDKINFLTGKNASGKSTMIDAIQLLLLGDANGRHFFNKAANEKSSRSLKGYLRGELGDDGDIGFKYLREGRFSSYIACEFFDDIKKSNFTVGVVFDCYEDGSDEHRFFILDSELPVNHFIVNSTPMTYKDLRSYMNKNYKKGKYEFPETDRGFQEILKGKFGGLKNKYFSLFKKAVSFTPITDIETFITEYVCDVKNPIDISLMQDNIRYYTRLEYEADMMETRVAALSSISDKYTSWMEEKQRLEIQGFIIDRARLQTELDEIINFNDMVAKFDMDMAFFSKKQSEYAVEIISETEKKDKLKQDLYKSDIHNKLEQLKSRKKELSEKIKELDKNIITSVQKLRKYAYEWRSASQKCLQLSSISSVDINNLFIKEIQMLEKQAAITENHSKRLLDINEKTIGNIAEESFQNIYDDTSVLKQTATGLLFTVDKRKEQLKSDIETYSDTLMELKKGIKAYDPKLAALRDEIKKELASKYHTDVPVFILADLLEIKDMRWRNAVEAYLHTQKFYLIVEPKYFIDALRVYDRLKFKMGFYDWGIVDTGKLEKFNPKCEKGSLAEEIITGYIYARQFVDFVMGKVIKCNNVEELRNHDKAITESCMLYQGYVARQLNPDRWKYPFIGRTALEEQIKSVQGSIDTAESEVTTYNNLIESIRGVANLGIINQNESEHYIQVVKNSVILPTLNQQLTEVVEEMGRIDLTWLLGLEGKIKECEMNIDQLNKNERECARKIIEAQKDQDSIRKEKLPDAEQQARNYRQAIEIKYNNSWIVEKGEPRFIKELQSRQSAKAVIDNFSSQLDRTRSQTQKKKDDLESARSDYNREYKMSYDIKQYDNSAYEKEFSDFKDIRLPEYRKQIQDAKDKAFQQFGDDFLAKLKANIDTVKSQIDDLNGALKESSWGNERYRFTWAPKAEYKRYYDMITDDMLLEGYNIASQLFRDKHRDSIDELFRQVTDVDAELNADARAELEKNIKRFTDYRTYLNFDLSVTDGEDRTQRLSKTLQKKSGGETQTPFYISVLASFAQLYRIQDTAYNRIRLIVFDEAFSKMDSERIQESIKVLRKFGFQCILSAPPEKIGDIAPLVDRNLCVIRDKTTSIVRSFDSKKLLEEGLDEL
jgi:uncharacterized protein YPO0396